MKTLPDFDELMKMTPEALTELRRSEADKYIASLPEADRAHVTALQCHIENVIATSSNPNQVNVRLYKDMMAKLDVLREALNNYEEFKDCKADVLTLNNKFEA